MLVTLDNIGNRMTKTTVQASAGSVSLVVIDEAEEMLCPQDRRKYVGELLVSLYSSKENGVPTHLLIGNCTMDYLTKFYQEITLCINKQFKLVAAQGEWRTPSACLELYRSTECRPAMTKP
jgi:hypothetical protein